MSSQGYYAHKYCNLCHGSGQVPMPDADALVALLDWCYNHSIVVTLYGKSQLPCKVRLSYYAGDFQGNTLAEAVARALGLAKA